MIFAKFSPIYSPADKKIFQNMLKQRDIEHKKKIKELEGQIKIEVQNRKQACMCTIHRLDLRLKELQHEVSLGVSKDTNISMGFRLIFRPSFHGKTS